MRDLDNMKSKVKKVLQENPETRDSDDLLYLKIIEEEGKSPSAMTLGHFLMHRKDYGLPSFETVRRTRQKAQAENPELKGSKVEERAEAEKEYRDFARR